MEMRLILKTPSWYSTGQISTVLIFSVIGIWGLLDVGLDIDIFGQDGLGRGRVELWTKIMVFTVVISGFWVLYGTVKNWFRLFYSVELDGKKLQGMNLFGAVRIFDLSEIVSVEKTRGFESLRYYDRNGRYFEVAPAIDYNGFLNDLLLTIVPIDAKIDHLAIERLRNRIVYWKYTKQNPPSTRYGVSYGTWLEKKVEEQRQILVSRGILKDGIIYGFQQWKKRFPKLRENGQL